MSIAYWSIETRKIIEWIEMQRILGLDKIIVYNNSLSTNAQAVFSHYANTDFLELRQSHNFMSDYGETTFHLHSSPVINDCMYRNMYRYKHIAILDFDEFMVPHANFTLLELIRHMENIEEVYHPTRSYVFQNAYFFFDHKPDTTQPEHLRTMRYRTRQTENVIGYSAKSIINPISCFAMHNHYCWGVNKLYENGNHMSFVPPSIGLLHHYKMCHLDTFNVKPGECQNLTRTGIQDDTMLKYKDKLLQAVDKRIEMIGL